MSEERADRVSSRPAPRRLARAIRVIAGFSCAPAVALLCAGAIVPTPALAATGHAFSGALTQSAGSPLEEPAAVAVDHSSGRTFVSDTSAGVVDVYDALGNYLSQFGGGSLEALGVAVNETSGLVYVADAETDEILVFKDIGSAHYSQIGAWEGSALVGKGFGEVTGVAVDNSKSASAGDVYVVDGEDEELEVGVADVFKPKPAGPEEGAEGSLVRVLSKGGMEEPNGIAVDDSSGRVYVADAVKGAVYQYSPAGEYEGKMNGSASPLGSFRGKEEEGNVAGVAVDPLSHDLLVAEAERGIVAEFSPTGAWTGWITTTPQATLGEPRGVALDGSGRVFVADAALARVDIYGTGAIVPDVTTEKAGKPTRTTAVLNGVLNGEGKPGQYLFQWGTSRALGTSTAPVAFAGGQEAVSQALSDLSANTTYYFRLVAENENGTSYGLIRELTTAQAVEKLFTGPASAIQPESATLTGSLAPNGVDAHYYFQWGLTASYGNTTPEPPGTDAGSEKGAVAAQADLQELSPNTAYHYRLVGANVFGATYGSDHTFRTAGPPRITGRPVTAIGHETATLNAEVNPDQLETTYRFQYGESTAYGSETPAGGEGIGSGASPVPVSAALTALKLGVTYHYRVIAENTAPGSPTIGPDRTFTTVPPALIDSWATDLQPTEATLHAAIDPLGNETTYYFQWGTQSCKEDPGSCSTSPAPPGQDIGAGEAPVPESLALTGLEPNTTYHYRVIAINALGESVGTERTITTPAPSLPVPLADNRAWEMVSPPDKGSAPVEALTREGGLILASTDGERLTYVVNGALGENVAGNRNPELQQILAIRGAKRWSSQDIATPNTSAKGWLVGNAPEYQSFTPTLDTALDQPVSHSALAEPPLAPGVMQSTSYLRDNATGDFTPLITEANTAAGTAFGGEVRVASATPDLSNVLLTSKVALLGAESSKGLYEWTSGALRYVSVLPNGTAPPKAELGFNGRVLRGALSTDGSRAIWTAPEGGVEVTRGHLYLRDMTRGETVKLDTAQGVAEPAKGSAQFQTASSDGSRVFFSDKQQLTADSTAEPGQGVGKPDLYECEIVEQQGKLVCNLKDLTVDHNEAEHAFVQTLILGASEAGSDVYLVARGVLAGNENGNGETAQVGGYNLYHLHYDGSQWQTTFIATLTGDDSPEWEGGSIFNLAYLTARVSPNGRYLAFMSAAPVTGYDNVDVNPEANGARDEEVFLYDSANAVLTCASCNPTGARPKGVLDQNGESGEGLGLLADRRKVWGAEGHEHWLAGNVPGWTARDVVSAQFQSRFLSDDGRLFFNSPDHLVPAAGNGKENVYEYEPAGLGSCERASGGCVALLSSGASDQESAFIEATPDGSSVFFVTESKLLPQDTDTAFDVYDARICTDLSPCLTAPAPVGEGCATTDTCRPASSVVQAPAGPAGSASFSGPANPAPAPPKSQTKAAKTSKPAAKPLTRKQKLTRALRRCKQVHRHARRKLKRCEAHARRLYGARKKTNQARGAGRVNHGSAPRHAHAGGAR